MTKLTINQVLQQGVDAHKAGQVQEAHRLYAAILKAQPKHPDANHNTGLLVVGFGKIELALPFFKTALEANPSNAQFWYSHIVALIKLERLIDAKVLLDQAKSKGIMGADFDQLEQRLNDANKALSFKPDGAEAYNNMGTALQKQNKLEEAIEAYNKALVIKPDYAGAYYNMGIALQKQNKLEEAIEAYNKALVIKPDYVDAYNNMGTVLQKQNKLEEAIEAYNKALVIKPDYAGAYYNMGIALQKQNKLEEAIEAFNKALVIKPDYVDAYNNMGIALKDQGKLEEAIGAYNKALSFNPDYAEAYNNMGTVLQGQNKLEEAIEAFNKALSFKPDYAEAYNNMGIALKDQGELEEAIGAYNKALSFKPDYAEAYNNMGIALKDQGKLEEAIGAYNKALSFKFDYVDAYNNMGTALQKQNKPEEAIEAYNKALVIKPDYVVAYNNMGIALKDQGKLEEAIEAFNKALVIKTDYAEVYNNMGNALQDQGKLEEAIGAYNKALVIKPDYVGAYNNMGTTLQKQNKLEEAIEAYNKALVIKPDYADAYYNMGIALLKHNKLEEAIEAYNKVLVIKPDYADAYYNMGIALQEQNKLEEAIEAYNKALSFKPDYVDARTQKLHQQAHICNWDSIAEDVNLIPELGTLEKHVSPFALLSLEDSPDRHLTRSKIYAKAKYPQKILSPKDKPSKRPKRIRIGYFSTDFKEHPVAYLIAKVLEQHNRDKFEVCGYSIHGTSSCEMRQRLEKSFDSFTDVQSISDRDIALQVRQDEIDIAVDLNGYTKYTRTGIFAYRAAPIQINYLGYPGTLGADFMDYIVADPVLIPEDKRWHYSEQIIYLPNTYQPTDNTRIISDKVIMRKDIGLPDKGFVFCCFNQNCKISPAEFDIWMRLLTSVKGSVLWLLKSNKWAEQNLKRQAEAHGVSSERIIFAERVPQAEHLARQRLADLFLDTFNYNAHTTASDALWAGLPLVTKLGKGFAARVAGSLLNAVGLPELITKSEQDYEALILKLATNPTKLAEIKEKLANNRLTQPLFNTELYTKQLEEGYQQAYQNYFDGNPPQTFIVSK